MKVLFIIATFAFLFIVLEMVKRHTSVPVEVTRKLAHSGAAGGAAALPLIASFTEIAIASAAFMPMMAISKSQNLFSAVHSVSRSTFGEVYFPIAVFLMAVLFPRTLPYVFGLLVMGISDTLASLVGQFGERRYRILGTTKTYIGSLSFATATFVIAMLMLILFLELPIWHLVAIAFLCSAVLALIEGISGRGTDNITVPIAAGTLMTWLTG